MQPRKSIGRLALSGAAILTLALGMAGTALAKGDFTEVTLTGGDLSGPVLITDPALASFFAFFGQPVSTPHVEGSGYTITRGGWVTRDTWRTLTEYVAWDQLTYYPDASGEGGFIYYNGLLDGSSEYDHHWYAVSPHADRVLRQLIAGHAAPAGRPSPDQMPFISLGALIVLVLGACFVQRRAVTGGVQSHRE